jgi:shikimate dehydrogenase
MIDIDLATYTPRVKGTTKLLGLIGDPVSHSLSPIIHNYWLEKYGIDAVYLPLPIKTENLSSTLTALVNAGFIGFNVTVPHKQAAFGVVQVGDFGAGDIKSINTIKVEESGSLTGYNTDGYGFYRGLETLGEQDFSKAKVVLIGAGGSAPAVATSLYMKKCRDFHFVNRTIGNAEELNTRLSLNAKIYAWDEMKQALQGANLVVNTTPLGMKGQSPLILPLDVLDKNAIVYDIVYNPRQTQLLEEAEHFNLKTLNGLSMLVYQAQYSFNYWFNISPEVTPDLFTLLEKHLPT